jgi:hypothetical protein
MGLGMGLVMSPMSTAAMNAVDMTKAGVASGILSMTRMVGGTFGVAVLGAFMLARGRSELDTALPDLSAGTREKLAESLGSSAGPKTGRIAEASHDAFVTALSGGLKIATAVALAGAVAAWVLVSPDAPRAQQQAATPGPATAEPVAADRAAA